MPDERDIRTLREQNQPLVWLWRVALTTPALYMLVGLAVNRWVFVERGMDGFLSLKKEEYTFALVASFVAALGMTGIVAWLRARRARMVVAFLAGGGDAARTPDERIEDNVRDLLAADALQPYRKTTFLMLILSDLIAFLGLLLFLAQADAVAQGALSVLAWFDYILSRPVEPKDTGARGPANS